MSYVTPNSTLQLFKGINLDNRYLHTIYFANEPAQDAWFTSKVFRTYGNLMYRRYQDNVVRIQADATELLGTTYMRFKNTRTASKWFYAFVLGVDYVNENTADVYYEIDVMQTWFIQNGSIRPCMVLREHTNNDTFGSNLEAEPIGSEVYDCDVLPSSGRDSIADDLFNGEYSVVINSTGEVATNDIVKQGLVMATYYKSLPMQGANYEDNIKQYMSSLLGSWDAGEQEQEIIDMYTVPTALAEQGNNFREFGKTVAIPSTYGGYTPKNHKMFMYPFSALLITTHDGDANMYRWEYFDKNLGGDVEFKAIGTACGGGSILCYPRVYNGQEDNLDMGLVIDGFPKNAYSYDAYEAWVASGGKTRLQNDEKITKMRGISSSIAMTQTVANNMVKTVAGVAGTAIGAVTGNIGLAGASAYQALNATADSTRTMLDTFANLMEAKNKIDYQWKDASYAPDIPVGKSSPSLTVGAHMIGFHFYHIHIRNDEAPRVDDFFSCYGYATNKVKQPNLTGRRYWNFVQTQGAVIAGDMPSSSKEAIGRIFDGGITFWHDGDQVGNYAQSVSDGSINNPII